MNDCLALALVISGIQSPRDSMKRDFPLALLIPVPVSYSWLVATALLFGVMPRCCSLS